MASTAALCREIAEALPDRPFALEFWDGGRVPSTSGGGPTLSFRSPRAIAQVLRSPGQLGLGRAYVLGDIDADDIDGVVALMGRWEAPEIGSVQKARDARAVRHHYDVSNEFLALFLDESMTYSCALWDEGVETLEDAQRAKLE